jgi:signal transduction histidine kinase
MSIDSSFGGAQSARNQDSYEAPAPLISLAKFRITKLQYFLGSVSLISILSLGVFSTLQSTVVIDQAKILSAVETPAASIAFTQRETLVYATRLGQWSHGGSPRRTVQIARSLLAQRLAVIDTSGKSMGSRAPAAYWRALRQADAIVEASPPGVLPEGIQNGVNAQISPVIDEILSESRQFVSLYQKSIDQTLIDNAQKISDRDRFNLILLYIFLIFGGLFLILNFRLNFRNYRIARHALAVEQVKLDQTIEELKQAQSTVVKLKDLDLAKNAFISTVNHELRTPLTSIIGYIDIIREEASKENIALTQYLDVIERNAEILLDQVESILSLNKIDSDLEPLPDVQVSVNKVIENAIFVLKPATEKKDLQVIFDAQSQCFVQGNANQLSQVVINLLGNAAKFSPQGASIEIKLGEFTDDSGRLQTQIQVIDHGIGIPPEDLEHLFARFFRAKNAVSQQYQGTGLGLAIVQQIVAHHGGQIFVESTLNQGSTFTVQIPTYTNSESAMISQRRPGVLQRAIIKLEAATPETLKAITHEVGGSISFYGSPELGAQILEFSRETKDLPDDESFKAAQTRFIHALQTELDQKTEDSDE